MTTHGRNRRMAFEEVVATVENVTVPGDAIHWGDVLRVQSQHMPNGKNYATIKTFPLYGSGGESYADRRTFTGDASGDELLFTIGASSAGGVNNGKYPTDGSEPQCYIWLDDDAALGDGRPPGGDLAPFLVLPPR